MALPAEASFHTANSKPRWGLMLLAWVFIAFANWAVVLGLPLFVHIDYEPVHRDDGSDVGSVPAHWKNHSAVCPEGFDYYFRSGLCRPRK